MASPSVSTVKTPTSIMTGPSSPNSNRRQRPPRPKITLNIPPPNASHHPMQSPFLYPAAGHAPPTALSGALSGYPESEANFMFKQLEGFRDFTKAGLGQGEKVAIWIYEKFSTWSKKWFTHIFLILVLFLFSLVTIQFSPSSASQSRYNYLFPYSQSIGGSILVHGSRRSVTSHFHLARMIRFFSERLFLSIVIY